MTFFNTDKREFARKAVLDLMARPPGFEMSAMDRVRILEKLELRIIRKGIRKPLFHCESTARKPNSNRPIWRDKVASLSENEAVRWALYAARNPAS